MIKWLFLIPYHYLIEAFPKVRSFFWYLGEVFIWLDQGLNVLLSPLLNLLVRGDGARFGSADETLSSVFGKNRKMGTCKACTWFCRWILHPIDKNHCLKSIEADEHSRL